MVAAYLMTFLSDSALTVAETRINHVIVSMTANAIRSMRVASDGTVTKIVQSVPATVFVIIVCIGIRLCLHR